MIFQVAFLLLACSHTKHPAVAEPALAMVSPDEPASPEKGVLYAIVPEPEDDDPFMKVGEGCEVLKTCCAEMKRVSSVAGTSCYDIALREGSCPDLMAEAVRAFTSWEALAGTASGPVPAVCLP